MIVDLVLAIACLVEAVVLIVFNLVQFYHFTNMIIFLILRYARVFTVLLKVSYFKEYLRLLPHSQIDQNKDLPIKKVFQLFKLLHSAEKNQKKIIQLDWAIYSLFKTNYQQNIKRQDVHE